MKKALTQVVAANEVTTEEKDQSTGGNVGILANDPESFSNDEGNGILKSIDEIMYEQFEKNLNSEFETVDTSLNDEEINENIPLEQAVQDYQTGCDEAFDFLYNHYKPIFDRVSYRHNDDDLAAELTIVLYRAAKTFKITGGAKFNTYYWKCARNHMGTLKIRKGAKKRTAENGVISLQQPVSAKDNDVEFGTFIEDNSSEKSYNDKIFELTLEEKVYPFLKADEVQACQMIQKGYTLEEIGRALGGITAPAVHVKFRRLANKKNVGKQLRELYKLYCS